jgi:hypothetical protein
MTMARVRPPMLPGPSETQPLCVGLNPAVLGTAINAAAGGAPPAGIPATCGPASALARELSSCRSALGNACGGINP